MQTDGCNLLMRVHFSDRDHPAWIQFLQQFHPGATVETLTGTYEWDEAENALLDPRTDLASNGVRFYGHHRNGVHYGGSAFYSDGAVLHDWSADEDGSPIIHTSINDGDVAAMVRPDEALVFADAFRAVGRQVDQSWELDPRVDAELLRRLAVVPRTQRALEACESTGAIPKRFQEAGYEDWLRAFMAHDFTCLYETEVLEQLLEIYSGHWYLRGLAAAWNTTPAEVYRAALRAEIVARRGAASERSGL